MTCEICREVNRLTKEAVFVEIDKPVTRCRSVNITPIHGTIVSVSFCEGDPNFPSQTMQFALNTGTLSFSTKDGKMAIEGEMAAAPRLDR